MSKHKPRTAADATIADIARHIKTPNPPEQIPFSAWGQPATVPDFKELPKPDKAESTPKHRRCPICWERCKGVGVQYSMDGDKKYYKCIKTLTEEPPCGHHWSAVVRLEVIAIEHRRVTLDGTR